MKKRMLGLLVGTLGFMSLANADNLVGGWYPIFMDSFDKSQLETLSKDSNVKNIKITYDENKDLAYKINDFLLKNDSKAKITINQEHNEDTNETKYEHNKVVLTVSTK